MVSDTDSLLSGGGAVVEVLLLEDDPAWQQAASVALGARGLHVTVFAELRAACAGFERARPALVLVDDTLAGPVEDSVRALAALAGTRRIPVVVLSMHDDPDGAQALLEAGAADVIPKSMQWTLVCERLFRVLRHVRDEPAHDAGAGAPPHVVPPETRRQLRIAEIDPASGLYTRPAFVAHAQRALGRRRAPGHVGAIVAIRLAGLAPVEAALGARMADALLDETARRLLDVFRNLFRADRADGLPPAGDVAQAGRAGGDGDGADRPGDGAEGPRDGERADVGTDPTAIIDPAATDETAADPFEPLSPEELDRALDAARRHAGRERAVFASGAQPFPPLHLDDDFAGAREPPHIPSPPLPLASAGGGMSTAFAPSALLRTREDPADEPLRSLLAALPGVEHYAGAPADGSGAGAGDGADDSDADVPGFMDPLSLDPLRHAHAFGGDGRAAGVAARLVAGRFASDGLALCFSDLDSAHAVERAALIVFAALRGPLRVAGLELIVHASIGYTLSPEHGRSAATLLARAGEAAELARRQGNGIAVAYAPLLGDRRPVAEPMMPALHAALEQDLLVLHYQPVVDAASGRPTGVEALLRWPHHGRLRGPAEFLAVARAGQLLHLIDEWVIAHALQQLHRWQSLGLDVASVAVNVEARHLARPSLVRAIRHALHATGLPASSLTLEFRLDEAGSVHGAVRDAMDALRALGVRLVLDDAGTGRATLAEVAALPLDGLKIDRSLVDVAHRDAAATAIVRALVTLGAALGVTVVAEGVEQRAQLSALVQAGCPALQGYYLSRPLPAGDLQAWWHDAQSGRAPGLRPRVAAADAGSHDAPLV